jgi:membrane dipeptidase
MKRFFDAHLDLAYLAESGRDLLTTLMGGLGPHNSEHSVAFPELVSGGVQHVLGTIFVEMIEPGKALVEPQQYHAGDWQNAVKLGRRQVQRYRAWEKLNSTEAPSIMLLIECADVIDDPADVPQWKADGLVAVGLTWIGKNRYAGGNATSTGLTDLAPALIREFDRQGIAHDASHLSDLSFWQLCELTNEPIIASHSNCRALLGGGKLGTTASAGENQRHLHDAQIKEIASRGGVIGLNLFSAFIDVACKGSGRASISRAIDHVEHVCMVAGTDSCVGLGSDLDGGFSATRLPEGINSPLDYYKLVDELTKRGWTDAAVEGFAWRNWSRFFGVQ